MSARHAELRWHADAAMRAKERAAVERAWKRAERIAGRQLKRASYAGDAGPFMAGWTLGLIAGFVACGLFTSVLVLMSWGWIT